MQVKVFQIYYRETKERMASRTIVRCWRRAASAMSGSKDEEETRRKHLTCRGTEGRGGDVPSESAPRGPLQAGHAFGFLEQEALGGLLAGTEAADAVAGCSGPHGQAAKAEQQVRAVFTVAVARHPVGPAISSPLFLDAFQESFGNCTPAEPGSWLSLSLPRGTWVTSQICLERSVAFQFAHCLEYIFKIYLFLYVNTPMCGGHRTFLGTLPNSFEIALEHSE